MDTREILATLFTLQKLVSRKAELVKAYAERYALNCRSDSARDLSLHKRDDGHGGHFDIDFDLQNRHREETELQAIDNEYDEVCEQIKLLESTLVDLEPPTLIFHR